MKGKGSEDSRQPTGKRRTESDPARSRAVQVARPVVRRALDQTLAVHTDSILSTSPPRATSRQHHVPFLLALSVSLSL